MDSIQLELKMIRESSSRGLFERPAKSFDLDARAIGWILADVANPLNKIVQIIPSGASVLDIGAGNGILARLLASLDRGVAVDAIEPDPVAREAAAPFYRSIFTGKLEDYLEGSRADEIRYNFIVLADVLEHLANPELVLRQVKALLSLGGRIIISTPNVAFASVRLALLNGRFDYVDSGILERTHLRFFTLKTLQRLFSAVELYPSAQFHCLRDPFASEISLDGLSISPWLLAKLARDELSFVYQFLFVLGTEPSTTTVRMDLGSRGPSLPIGYFVRKARGTLGRFY
jgi:2-polyprenyl-3-methyl-5-hydroxy-6-metoxy-1,4-benzoquinol methylase